MPAPDAGVGPRHAFLRPEAGRATVARVRFGVSGKIFVAYAALLAAFAGNASFTVLTMRRARQGVVANQAYLDLQGSVDAAWKSLNDFAGALGRNLRKEPNL